MKIAIYTKGRYEEFHFYPENDVEIKEIQTLFPIMMYPGMILQIINKADDDSCGRPTISKTEPLRLKQLNIEKVLELAGLPDTLGRLKLFMKHQKEPCPELKIGEKYKISYQLPEKHGFKGIKKGNFVLSSCTYQQVHFSGTLDESILDRDQHNVPEAKAVLEWNDYDGWKFRIKKKDGQQYLFPLSVDWVKFLPLSL